MIAPNSLSRRYLIIDTYSLQKDRFDPNRNCSKSMHGVLSEKIEGYSLL